MNVTDQSMGENSLQTRFVTSGIDKDGKPYDIKHSLFLEFDNKDSDKIKRGVEYLESGESASHSGRSGGGRKNRNFPLGLSSADALKITDVLVIPRTILKQIR